MQPKTTAVIASVVLLIAGVSLWRTFRSSATQFNSSLMTGTGQALADEVAKAVRDRGRIVAVITADHQQAGNPSRVTWEAFRQELQKHNGISLAGTETIAFDPNDPQPDMTGCPIAAFKSILERHGQADAIVFFMGVPAWDWLQARNLLPPPLAGKLVVLAGTTMGPKQYYEGYFKNEVISTLILRWPGRVAPVANPKAPRQWFAGEYQIFTSQNYDSLPE